MDQLRRERDPAGTGSNRFPESSPAGTASAEARGTDSSFAGSIGLGATSKVIMLALAVSPETWLKRLTAYH
jgi:hypothetical protein